MDIGAEALTGTLARDAIPRRYDLDPSHPLYGKRALTCVPAGTGDIVISDAGVLEPAQAQAIEPEEPGTIERPGPT